MQLSLSLPSVLPSHQLGSKVTPCHQVPSCAFLVPCWAPQAAPGRLMCLWPHLRPHWCCAEGPGRSWHWPGFGFGNCLFYTTSVSVSLWGRYSKSVSVCWHEDTSKNTSVFPLPTWIRDANLWKQPLCAKLCPCTCVCLQAAVHNVTSWHHSINGESWIYRNRTDQLVALQAEITLVL